MKQLLVSIIRIIDIDKLITDVDNLIYQYR